MGLELFFHPLASFCWKALIALYENGTAFEPHIVDLSDPAQKAELERLWPLCKFPVLRDHDRGRVVPEATIIIEYLAQHHPGSIALIPKDADLAREARLRDRFYDGYVHEPMQKIVLDKLRPEDKRDPYGVAQASRLLDTAYAMIEAEMVDRKWAIGDDFTLADCAAAPALHYADLIHPLGEEHPQVSSYLRRLTLRPSFARVLQEAEPYFSMFPGSR